MPNLTNNFFEGKRPWSKIKDQVLEQYMPGYLAKVNTLKPQRSLLLIDGYAGPGVFEDGTRGSPYIICKAAEKHLKGNYRAIFINNHLKYHRMLEKVIHENKWSETAQAIKANSKIWLQDFSRTLKNQTVFLYLDPFGPTGCTFEILKPFLDRNPAYSTEILLTMNTPGIHRLASRHAVEAGYRAKQHIQVNHQILTNVFGGNYWQDIMFQQNLSPEDRIKCVIAEYTKKLSQYLPFSGSCPVRELGNTVTKYYIIFASRHKDAMLLLNDIMVKAYSSVIHDATYDGSLWEDANWSWRDARSISGLDKVILSTVQAHPGETRKFTWFRIVQAHFKVYLESEYRNTVQKLIDEKRLVSPTPRRTKRLNDDCTLYLP